MAPRLFVYAPTINVRCETARTEPIGRSLGLNVLGSMVATILWVLLTAPRPLPQAAPLATVNGATGHVAVNGQPFVIELAATNATACQMVLPGVSGISTSSTMTIEANHPWYPHRGDSTVLKFQCLGRDRTTRESVLVVSRA